MQKVTLLSLTALVMVAVTLIVCRSMPRFESETHLLPIERFPQRLGTWHAGPDIPVDPEVQRKIPTARLLERAYRRTNGQTIDLLLLTATDDQDFHAPTACLPGQGWTLSDQGTTSIAGHTVNRMTAVQDGTALTVLYYWVKLADGPGRQVGAIYHLRRLLNHENLSLFVRIIVPASRQMNDDLIPFAALTWDAVQPILGRPCDIVLDK